MRIDIWSDVMCPFCWIGKRHLEKALETFRAENPDVPVSVVWRAYELDPSAPVIAGETTGESSASMLARKYGMSTADAEASQEQMAARFAELGLEYDWRSSQVCSSHDAQRLAALAAEHGRANEVDEALRKAHFTDGQAISDPEVLRHIGIAAGIPAEAVEDLLAGKGYADTVAKDIEIARGIGVQGVPFFVFEGRLAVSGAQPVEVFSHALNQALTGADA